MSCYYDNKMFRGTPLSFLSRKSDSKQALIILNTPLAGMRSLLNFLWSKASYKACVDGGVNELFKSSEPCGSFLPDVITGDFDSVNPDILKYYKDKGVEVSNTPDQNFTDFSKCLKLICERIAAGIVQAEEITVLAFLGGRFDHFFANINTLFLSKKWTNVPVRLVTNESVAFLVSKGKCELNVDTGLESPYCGLIPIGCCCENVTTTGLKWNLDNVKLEFGSTVSTSNGYDGSGTVTIETEKPLLWTMGFKNSFNLQNDSQWSSL